MLLMRNTQGRRCYVDYGDGTECGRPAEYEARVNWTAGVMFLCREHAASERAHGDVLEIRSLRT